MRSGSASWPDGIAAWHSPAIAGLSQAVAGIVSRLGGEAAGSAVAAALANMLAPPEGSGRTGDPAQPGTPSVHVTTSIPEVRVVSGPEAAEMMRQFLGQGGQAPDGPADEV